MRLIKKNKSKTFFLNLCFIFCTLIVFPQQKSAHPRKRTVNPNNHQPLANLTFNYCDNDSDSKIPIDIDNIENVVLQQNAAQFGYSEGIYLSSGLSKIYFVSGLSGTPVQTELCMMFPYAGMNDIAINQEEEIYAVIDSNIAKIDKATCSYQFVYTWSTPLNSLSFDRNHNLYFGGGTSVYRIENTDFTQVANWHDFISGGAAGDFVMYKDKMYIAWKTGSCRLYEVTVDSTGHYVTHTDLGMLPDDTFGLASDLGYLYGVTPNELYRINPGSMAFETILNNPLSDPDWTGAAGKNEAVNFVTDTYETAQNATDNVFPLPQGWENSIAGGQTVYVKIVNTEDNQSIVVPVDLVVDPAPEYVNPTMVLHCLAPGDPATFNLRDTEAGIVGSQANMLVGYFESEDDARNDINPLPDLYPNNTHSQIIYVRITNTQTQCYAVFSFELRIDSTPVYHKPDNLIFCHRADMPVYQEVNFRDVITQVIQNQDAQNNTVTFYNLQEEAYSGVNPLDSPYFTEVEHKEIFVRIENTTGCFSVGSFIISVFPETANFPVDFNAVTSDWTYDSNSIRIEVLGTGDYEYSLDGFNYQNSPVFEGLPPGKFQVFVKDKGNCGITAREIFLLMYPAFFTPNQDGYNDYWKIRFSFIEPDMRILIFDRYGKLLKSLNAKDQGWDGNYNNYPMPSSDYWFTVYRNNGKEYKGHFSLKR